MTLKNGEVTIGRVRNNSMENVTPGDTIELEVQGIPVKYKVLEIDWNKNVAEVRPNVAEVRPAEG